MYKISWVYKVDWVDGLVVQSEVLVFLPSWGGDRGFLVLEHPLDPEDPLG